MTSFKYKANQPKPLFPIVWLLSIALSLAVGPALAFAAPEDTPPSQDATSAITAPAAPTFEPPAFTPPSAPTFESPAITPPTFPSTDPTPPSDSEQPPSDDTPTFPPTIDPPVPPTFEPPVFETPTLPSFEPPAPPTYEPPTFEPPAPPTIEFPPPNTDQPPTEQPPSELPPSEQPPVFNPVTTPPASSPPTTTPTTTDTPSSSPTQNPPGLGSQAPASTPTINPATQTPPQSFTPTAPVAVTLAFTPPATFNQASTPAAIATEIPTPPTTTPVVKQSEAKNSSPATQNTQRSAFVRSVRDRTQLHFNLSTLIKASLWALLLVLLIIFPAELFNSTLAANYDEVTGWFRFKSLRRATEQLNRLPKLFGAVFLAAIGAVLNSQLSTDFGYNRASLALVIGMFITLMVMVFVYDILRASYMHRRFRVKSTLRTHGAGMAVALVFVFMSRLAHFMPGYFYGLFTALIFSRDVTDKEDGEGLMVATISLLVVAALGWWLWPQIKSAASAAGANFWVLVIDSTLASLWVAALGAIVFGLAPIRFFYGEQVKKWNQSAWLLIYFVGTLLFVYTLLDPNQSVYGKSGQTTWVSVLMLFFGFGLFSLLFWGYFRYRHLWRHTPEEQEHLY